MRYIILKLWKQGFNYANSLRYWKLAKAWLELKKIHDRETFEKKNYYLSKIASSTLEFKDVSQWNHMMQMTANAIQGSDHKSSTLDSNFDQSITISVSPIEI